MSDEKTPFHNPFGALGALRDKLPAAKPDPMEAGASPDPMEAGALAPAHKLDSLASAPAGKKPGKTYPRAVVRMERSGRGGKEATVIEQLALTPVEREAWLKALKSALGCGGSIEGDTLMLQGDQRTRLPRLLADRGVKKVTLG